MENFGWAVPFVLMAGIAVVFAIALGFILPKEGDVYKRQVFYSLDKPLIVPINQLSEVDFSR